MAATRAQGYQHASAAAVTVQVVDRDDHVRNALRDLLELAGYCVTMLEDPGEVEDLIETGLEPLLLIVGNADTVDNPDLQHFTALATNVATRTAYVYFTIIPQRSRLPGLVQQFIQQQADSTVDLPYELAHLLAIVAAAAEHACS